MKTNRLFLLIFVVIIMSCEKSNDNEINNSLILKVRIENSSDYDFHELIFENKEIGYLKKGNVTSYFEFDTVYQDLAYVHVIIENEIFILQPIDYDAPEITDGKYTYVIDVVDFENHSLSLQTHIDD